MEADAKAHRSTTQTVDSQPPASATRASGLTSESLVAQLPVALALLGSDGCIEAVSASLARDVARAPSDLVGMPIRELIDRGDGLRLSDALRTSQAQVGSQRTSNMSLRRPDGVSARAEVRIRALEEGGWVVRLHAPRLSGSTSGTLVPDVEPSSSPHNLASLGQWQLSVHELISGGASPEAIFESVARLVDHHLGGTCVVTIKDHDGGHWTAEVVAAPSLEAILGLRTSTSSPEHDPTQPGVDITTHLTDVPMYQQALAAHGATDMPMALLDPETAVWSAPIASSQTGRPVGRVSVLVDPNRVVTDWDREVLTAAASLAGLAAERRRSDLEIRQQALYDPLSQLPRRGLFIDRVSQALRRSASPTTAVIFVQLAELHLINTSYGIDAGDLAVTESARRLESVVGSSGTVARFGGDEFALLVERADASAIAGSVQSAFVPAWELRTSEGPVFVHPHVLAGLAYADPADDAASLCRKAQSALRWAHQPGAEPTVVYEESRRAGSVERLALRGDLRQCVSRGELRIDYQPKVNLNTGLIAGAEALVRWHHPTHGVLRPDQFIALAEESGVIVDIGEWVLVEAVRTAARWRRDGLVADDFLIAVNMSARQLWSPAYGDLVAEVLEQEAWPAEQLSLELTETLLVSNYEELLVALGRLKGNGVLLAADDFGTGYSALSYLDELPLDILKVDKGFVARIRSDGGGSVVATGVVSMADELSLKTCGEGVETTEQLAGLRALGCHWAQGYLIARPLSPDRFTELAQTGPRW
ncbi:MAG: sensor domain-containing phosphodiesterase [Microthrixaceae bacterium]